MQLAKMDRLAAVGMLATSHIKYHFKDGKCVGFDPYREPTSEIFFYLIDEINYIMQDLKFILGSDFLFYWVDGVFFKPTTSVRKIESVENLLTTLNYPYRYEKVENFSVQVETDKVIIKMTKNDEQKRYEFSTGETGKEIKERPKESSKRRPTAGPRNRAVSKAQEKQRKESRVAGPHPCAYSGPVARPSLLKSFSSPQGIANGVRSR
jgi:hypothetical protein